MAQKKIIAVIGSTGAQGGGLVRAIVSDRGGPFAARAITRKPDSEKEKVAVAVGPGPDASSNGSSTDGATKPRARRAKAAAGEVAS